MEGSSSNKPYQRILLKISGESFGKNNPFEMTWIHNIAEEIKQAHLANKEIGIVVGGGNIVRGSELIKHGIKRPIGDYMGMLATVINALALQDILSDLDVEAVIMTAREIEGVGEAYHYQNCLQHLNSGKVLIFAEGTGSPYFTTDTAAALKAAEIGAEVFFKATKVDGVFDKDPVTNPEARKFESLSYEDVLLNRYRVMDSTAIAFCLDNNLPILIFNLTKKGNFLRASLGENVGTVIKGSEA
ncbi:UMP kinase [Candidatus Uabimicrobium amorphum]|uniref:Uridylate kinase n=1 Tax=Uabimicrobium amorphum TaxID=2596890 RepID=A0A5S9F485_UABAM|nr:UMP kinase [Candidatus Uabimicrobium amorphum]BBM85535.1 uridylate kinase [Candidatus Uabimicrobium amorphum]